MTQKQRPIRRFPHVYQLDEMDCGAACLAMICRHFGRPVGISHIRQAVHTSTDGTTLAGITRGAEELGLSARSVRASKSRLDDLPLPAVVHWEGNHWVVVYRVDDKHVRVSDPARGLRKIPREEFLERWSGYTSVVGYTERLADAPEARTSLAWIRPFLRPHRRLGLFAVALAIVAAALELVLPILTQVVVDRVLPTGDLELLWVLMAVIVAVLLAITGATLVQRYLLAKVAVRFDVATLDFLTGRLLALPMSYFTTRRTGDIERRLLGARQVRAFFVQSGVEALTSVTQLLAALGLMFYYSWKLALVYLVTAPLYAGLMRFSAKRLRPMYDNLEEAYGRYSSGQIDAIRGIETVKALAAEEALRRLMLARFQTLADRVFRTEFLVLAYQGSLQLVAFASFGLFLVAGSIEVVHGNLTLGEFVAFNALVALATGPLLMLLSLWDQGQLARVLFDRLDDVVAPEPEQGTDRDRLQTVSTLEGRVALHGVGFRYGGPEAPAILEDVTLTRRAGRDGRARRAQRLRQDDADQAPRRPAGADRGRDPLRRLRAANARLPDAPAQDRLRPAGELSLRRLDRRQHRLRGDGSRPGQSRLGREGRQRARVRRAAAARLRDARRRVGPTPLRRPAAADRDRARPLPPPADPALRRGHERARHRVGARRQGEPRRAARRPHLVRDRAPAQHRPRRAPDHRARARPDRGVGHARRADGAAGPLLLPREPAAGALTTL